MDHALLGALSTISDRDTSGKYAISILNISDRISISNLDLLYLIFCLLVLLEHVVVLLAGVWLRKTMVPFL